MIKRFLLWLYSESKLWWFLFLVTATIFSAWLNQTYVLTDIVYYNTYGEQLSIETIESMIGSARRYSWIAYITVPIIIIIRILFTSICLYLAVFFKDVKESFGTCFNIALKSDAIFLVAVLFHLLYQGLMSSNDLIELSNNPLQLVYYLDIEKLPQYLLYPISLINVFELLYWVVLALLIGYNLKYKFFKSIEFVAASYGLGLILIILIFILIFL